MKRVTNELLKKEFQKTKNNLIIGIVFIVLSLVCAVLLAYDQNKTPKNTTYLNDVIEKQNNATNVEAHLDIKKVYSKIANLDGNTTKYIVAVSDGQYIYLVYMDRDKYDELIAKKDLETNPVKVYGKTKTTDTQLKNIAIKWYNTGAKADEKITSSDFQDYFGGVYLDTTENSVLFVILVFVAFISSICAFSFIIVYIARTVQTNNTLKKIDDEELAKIEKELDDKDTFHYERAHLILTKNYIISLVGKLAFLKYKDVIWVYEYRLKQYGVTTNKSLMAMTKDGKVRAIVQVDGLTKKSSAVLGEIAETIVSKNEKILIGYTNDNRKKANEIAKENKNKNKEK